VFVVHSESACRRGLKGVALSTSAWCRAQSSAVSCVITDDGGLAVETSVTSGGENVDRMVKHATAWAIASREGRAALVIEDDVVLTDLGPAEVCAEQTH
jgi:hypothetical protein